jgi:hypothetical protein
MTLNRVRYNQNLISAKRRWPGRITPQLQQGLKYLSMSYGLVVAAGDLTLIEMAWYVTHVGLLRLAHRKRCAGIDVHVVKSLSDSTAARWVFKAVIRTRGGGRSFVGYGDADPSNVNSTMQGAELRIAETRAVNRALRKAYGIGICSVEELGISSTQKLASNRAQTNRTAENHSGNGQPRLRDQLCLLIRDHQLDPALVKAYAADFCGTATLSGANRELIESFISHLSTAAKENRDSLVCKLNSYARSGEVQP